MPMMPAALWNFALRVQVPEQRAPTQSRNYEERLTHLPESQCAGNSKWANEVVRLDVIHLKLGCC